MKPLVSSKKKKILNQLQSRFGITNLPYLLLQFGKEKIRAYSGNLSKEELYTLDNNLRIETIGLYFANEQEEGVRLTIDGVQLLKNQIGKNIISLSYDSMIQWFRGNDLDIKHEKGFVILSYGNELIGCGKSTGLKISNYVPKERRIK